MLAKNVKPYAKAIVAALSAALATAGASITDGITPAEWISVAGVALAAFTAVWWTPNAPAPTEPSA